MSNHYRIMTDKCNDQICYYIQQRYHIFFWKTLYETVDQTDARNEFLKLKHIADTPRGGMWELYQPKDNRPIPSKTTPPSEE